MRSALSKRERCRSNIRLSVADEDVAVTPKTPKALVLVGISIIGIQKATMAQHEIEHRIAVTAGLGRVALEDIVNLPSVVFAARHLTVAVVIGLTPRIGQPLELVTLRRADKAEILV